MKIELEQIIKQLNDALYLGSGRRVAAIIENDRTTNNINGWIITDEDGIAITKTYGTLKELFEHQNPPAAMFPLESYDGCLNKDSSFSELKGKTISAISGLTSGSDEVLFYCTDGTIYKMLHYQDCCESVTVDDVCGDVNDIVGSEILVAEENSSSNGKPKDEFDESFTWTFYKLATRKGYVDIRWYGTSNGYCSEKVDFVKIRIS